MRSFMDKKFNIMQMDCEERFGFASAGMTAAGKFSSLIPGIILTALFYGVLSLLKTAFPANDMIKMFFPYGEANRTFIPLITVFAAMWCLSVLWIKKRKLSVQKKLVQALAGCADDDAREAFIAESVETPAAFAAVELFLQKRRWEKRDLPAAETDTLLTSVAAEYEKASDTSFIFVSTLIWAVPVLGFIGTVLGLAKAVSKFGLLASAESHVSFESVLPQLTGGLATAFETTLIALILALILQILASCRRQAEEQFFGSLKTLIGSE